MKRFTSIKLPAPPVWMPSSAELRQAYAGLMRDPTYRILLTQYVCRLLPASGALRVLDIGAGDGSMIRTIADARQETEAFGVEVFLRDHLHQGQVPLVAYDGRDLPFANDSFDVVLLINVVHHAADQRRLLDEACRVAARKVIIKDHRCESWIDFAKLAVLDVAGNLRFGASATGDYRSMAEWESLLVARPGWRLGVVDEVEFRRGVLRRIFSNALEVMMVLDREPSQIASNPST